MEVKCDFAVVGAGPAGATLAALLAKKGHDVVLIDRDSFPRDKVCGEFLSYDAFPLLEAIGLSELADSVASPAIERCVVHGRKRRFDFEFPRPARGLSRYTLDHALVRAAGGHGARLMLDTTVTGFERIGDTFRVRSAETTVVARRIIATWGRWGRLDRSLERSFVSDRTHRHFGFKRHYTMSRNASAIELHSFDRGYLGVADVDGGKTNISGLVHDSRLTNLKGGWSSFTETLGHESSSLRALFEAARPAGEFLTSEPVIFQRKSAEEHEAVFAGDAAAMIDPLTGNGMALAMQSALLLAVHAPRLLRDDDASARYANEYEALFAKRIRWSRRVAFLLSHPTLIDRAIAVTPARRIARLLMERTRAAERDITALLARY
jgi:menaquinone-9 beta-reductase